MQCDYISREKSRQIEGSILVLRDGPTELVIETTGSDVTFPQAETPIKIYRLIDTIGSRMCNKRRIRFYRRLKLSPQEYEKCT